MVEFNLQFEIIQQVEVKKISEKINILLWYRYNMYIIIVYRYTIYIYLYRLINRNSKQNC